MHTTPERTALVRMAGRSCWRISAADEEPLQFLTILESNGLDDALWGLRSTPQDSRLFAVWCARQVQHLMTDPRSIEALDVAESGGCSRGCPGGRGGLGRLLGMQHAKCSSQCAKEKHHGNNETPPKSDIRGFCDLPVVRSVCRDEVRREERNSGPVSARPAT